jgi:5'-3' exonuclease
MILVDLNQIMIGGLMVQVTKDPDKKVNETLVRHMILNTLRFYRKKFREEYGEFILCCDSRHYWRKDVFPNYKANRKKDRASSDLDWGNIFEFLNRIKQELIDIFPYMVLEVYGAEADDIIAVIIKNKPTTSSKDLILSSDKDFIQLHSIQDTYQFSPVTKKFIKHKDPVAYLYEHIIKGDRSDGVPNVLSPDDSLVEGIRQKTIRKTVITEVIDLIGEGKDPLMLHNLLKSCSKDTWIRNWQRNNMLVNLDSIPEKLVKEISLAFVRNNDGYATGLNDKNGKYKANRSKLFDYFIKNGLTDLIQNIGDF